MPIYRDPHTGKLKLDKAVAIVYALVMMCTMGGTSVGAYYSFKAVTLWRLEKCEVEVTKCGVGIKEVNDKILNHAMGESGTQARIAALEHTVDKIDNKLDTIIELSKATRVSQQRRGF